MVEEKQNPLRLSYRDDDSGDYKCIRNSDKLNQGILTIKFRSECTQHVYTILKKSACDSFKTMQCLFSLQSTKLT